MEKPPPYDNPDGASLTNANKPHTSSSSVIPQFHIRKPTKADAMGMFRVNEDVQRTLNATRDTPQPASQIETSIMSTAVPNIVQLVAVAPLSSSKPRSSTVSTLIHKLASHTIEKSSAVKMPDVLGYVHLIPFVAGGHSDIGRSCYDRTASVVMNVMSEGVLGWEVWRSVVISLVEEVCARAVEEGHRYKIAVITISYHNDHPSLVRYRDVLLEAGFVEKGRLTEVVQKGDLWLDRLYLQKYL